MYNTHTPLYPFGFGLSYTSFAYSDLKADRNTVSVRVKNTGECAGDEVVQLYLDSAGLDNQPMLQNCFYTAIWKESPLPSCRPVLRKRLLPYQNHRTDH